jgi:hypothetical protein
MTSMLVQGRLHGVSGTGVLADRALLVVSEYLQQHELPADGREILQRFRERYQEACDEAARPGLSSMVAASVDVVAVTDRALKSLSSGQASSALPGGSPTIERILATIEKLQKTGHADEAEVRLLQEFLDHYSEYTLVRETPRLPEDSFFA